MILMPVATHRILGAESGRLDGRYRKASQVLAEFERGYVPVAIFQIEADSMNVRFDQAVSSIRDHLKSMLVKILHNELAATFEPMELPASEDHRWFALLVIEVSVHFQESDF